MISKAFSIYDGKAKIFHTPWFRPTAGLALRELEDLVNDNTTTICRHSGDFTLYEVGEYDDQNAEYTQHVPIKLLGTALEYKKSGVTPLEKINVPLDSNSSEAKKELLA